MLRSILRSLRWRTAFFAATAVCGLLLVFVALGSRFSGGVGGPTAVPVGELPIPTRTPTQAGQSVNVAPATPRSLPTLSAPLSAAILPDYRARFGASGANQWLETAVDAGLPLGIFMNWRVDPSQPLRPGVQFWHTVRLGPDGVRTDWADIERVTTAQPGAVWIIGNEPDVIVQDNLTPQQYARLFHQVVTYIKARDPDAQIAIAGVAQPTPLRMAYLDLVLNSYQAEFGAPMPIDIWTVHAFILREEAGSWGVGIPPGMGSDGARLYEIGDHANLEIMRQNLVAFRAWMAEKGYQQRPLAITEYGIVMPPDYGFPPELVANFMLGSFDFFTTAANPTGYPADDYRLVQWWLWFSLYEAEEGYGTGNLVGGPRGQLTPLGQLMAAYINRR